MTQTSSDVGKPKTDTCKVLAAGFLALAALALLALVNGRALEQYLFGLSEVRDFLLNQTRWPVETVTATAIVIWAAYTVAFTKLSYTSIASLFAGRPSVTVLAIGFLSIAAQAPLLLIEGWLHEQPFLISDLANLQCFDTRTVGRVTVWYYREASGAINLFEHGYGGSWKGRPLQPATQEICDAAQALWRQKEEQKRIEQEAIKAREDRAKEEEQRAKTEKMLARAASIKTRNFQSTSVQMPYERSIPLFGTTSYSLGITVVLLRTSPGEDPQSKATATLSLNVCNNGQNGINSHALFVWYVPDDQSMTVRWQYPIGELPTGACNHVEASTALDVPNALQAFAGTLFFSIREDQHFASIHVADFRHAGQ